MTGLFLFSLFVSAVSAPDKECSEINFCRVEKKTFKKNWKTEYVKEMPISRLCDFDRPVLQLEPELGIEVQILGGEVKVNLFTYKLTYSVAGGSAPLSLPHIQFTHRLAPKSPTVVEVGCFKK